MYCLLYPYTRISCFYFLIIFYGVCSQEWSQLIFSCLVQLRSRLNMNHTCCTFILTHASYGKTYNLLFLLVTGQVLYQCSGRTGWSDNTLFFHVGICHFCVVPFLSIRILMLYVVIHKHLCCSCLLDEHINSLTRLRLLPIIFCTVSAIANH